MGVFKNGNIPPEAMIAMGSQLMGSAGTPNQFGALGQAGNTLAQFMLAQREQEAQRQRDEEERKYRQERMDLDRERMERSDPMRNLLVSNRMSDEASIESEADDLTKRAETISGLPPLDQEKLAPLLRSPGFWDALEQETKKRQPMNTAGGAYDFEAGKIIPGTGPQRQPDRRVVGGQIIDVDANRATDIEGYRAPREMGPDFKDTYSALAKATKERNDLINMMLKGGDAADFNEAVSIAREKFPSLFGRIDELENKLGIGVGDGGQRQLTKEDLPVPAIRAIMGDEEFSSLTETEFNELVAIMQAEGKQGLINHLKEMYGNG